MFKKYLTLILAVLVINLSFGATVFAGTAAAEKKARSAQKVKANIARLGTGKDARVDIKLRDGARLKGWVSQINENNFVVVNDRTGDASEVAYTNAKQVKGNNLATGVQLAIGIGVLIIVVLVAGHFAR